LVWLGRLLTVVCMVIGCLIAPALDQPKFGGVFQFIQQFQGYIWPGVVAAFLFGMLVERAPGAAGVASLLAGPLIYHCFQTFAKELHFLVQVALTFSLVLAVMGMITVVAAEEARRLRAGDLDMRIAGRAYRRPVGRGGQGVLSGFLLMYLHQGETLHCSNVITFAVTSSGVRAVALLLTGMANLFLGLMQPLSGAKRRKVKLKRAHLLRGRLSICAKDGIFGGRPRAVRSAPLPQWGEGLVVRRLRDAPV
jgi:hypothetical protein